MWTAAGKGVPGIDEYFAEIVSVLAEVESFHVRAGSLEHLRLCTKQGLPEKQSGLTCSS